jgi:hypothetical protein
MNFFHTLLPSEKKPKFWVNRPHEGPEEYEFDLVAVVFSDGITRFIFKSEMVPEDYWPRMVYILNMMTGCYECVGNYEKKGGRGVGGGIGEHDGYSFVAEVSSIYQEGAARRFDHEAIRRFSGDI